MLGKQAVSSEKGVSLHQPSFTWFRRVERPEECGIRRAKEPVEGQIQLPQHKGQFLAKI
jgi:hypothetical protein